jgi:hypothetical protein
MCEKRETSRRPGTCHSATYVQGAGPRAVTKRCLDGSGGLGAGLTGVGEGLIDNGAYSGATEVDTLCFTYCHDIPQILRKHVFLDRGALSTTHKFVRGDRQILSTLSPPAHETSPSHLLRRPNVRVYADSYGSRIVVFDLRPYAHCLA